MSRALVSLWIWKAVGFSERKMSRQASHGNQVFISWVIFVS